MLIDDITITIQAGNGGNGSVHFKRNAMTAKGGPDGGNGGNGGNIYLQGIDDILGLQEFQYKKKVAAENGVNGGRQNLYGRHGEDLIVRIPVGTHITDTTTNERWEMTNVADKILIATGGKGGKGNNEFKTAIDQAPYYAEKGGEGQIRTLNLELKLIADIGFIGLPNAGKSSLLKALTNANPKIGDYPFTTLEPNLGVMPTDGRHVVLADIPGLIEGASKGKGLGIKFLRHVEKTAVLMHCIDSTSETIEKDYETVRKELENYSSVLAGKKEIIVLTKKDLVDTIQSAKVVAFFEKQKKEVITVSIFDRESLQVLQSTILKNI